MSHTEKKHDQYYEMANAPISHIIPKLAAPTIVSMLISSIYNMADTFFVSQLGTSASGAVGVIFSAMSIIQALAFMIGMGSGNYMTRSLGAGKRELAEQIVSIAFFTGIIMGLVITVSATFNIHRVVLLLGATETIAPYAEAYAHYIFIAAPIMDFPSLSVSVSFYGCAIIRTAAFPSASANSARNWRSIARSSMEASHL
mgnify:CR=1 FL=1